MQKNPVVASKIVNRIEFANIREKLREDGLKVIHCHGVFDLLHPGHIEHLEEAKKLGDILVVSITSAPYVRKGPGRPYFNDELRLKTLAALEYVDYVMLSEAVTVMEVLEYIKPDLYVKGKEYENYENDVTQNIGPEVDAVRKYGGDVYFTDGVNFSSTKLINNHFSSLPPGVKEYAMELSSKYSFDEIRKIVDSFQDIKVLVIGDIIIDEYVFCNVQGLMSKDRAFSAKYIEEEQYLGGSLAVARHLAQFSNNVTVMSIVGNEPHIHSRILHELSKIMLLDLHVDESFRTAIKRRYIERHGIRNEYEKIFSVNYLMNEDELSTLNRSAFYSKLASIIQEYDLVVVTDYGHGLIDEKIMDIVEKKSKFLAVNCQTNSSNYGTNLITKYRRIDTFTLDYKEICLALNTRSSDYSALISKLRKYFKSSIGWLTLGSLGAVSSTKSGATIASPALTITVQDTIGAGDAFYAVSSLCAKAELPADVATFLSNIAGAIEANVLGNSKPVSKSDLLKFASTLLKF
ncbi:MAG: PfkB family carbohydrate kinase [Bacillota bacterium]